MKKFFLSHPDVILAVVALVLLGTLLGFFTWGINDVVTEVHGSITSVPTQSSAGFDLKDAAIINYRGVSTDTIVSTQPVAPVAPVTATTTASSTEQ